MEGERGATPPPELVQVLEASSEFASYPGLQHDASSEVYVPGLEDSVVSCLDKIFGTKYGASFIPNLMVDSKDYHSKANSFLQVGLQAKSETIKWLACRAVCHLMDMSDDKGAATHIIIDHNIYPLLLNCLIDGNERTSAASSDAIRSIAQTPQGIDVIFTASSEDPIQLRNLAARSSSLARIRILALITKLYPVSSQVAKAIHDCDLLSLYESEINNVKDPLTSLNAMELLYELVESSNDATLLLRSTLLQLLIDIISNSSVDSIFRSRAALIGGRLLRSADAYTAVDQSVVTSLLSAIGGRLLQLESQMNDEIEAALESLGLIGTTKPGANLLLTSSQDAAKLVVESAFNGHHRGKQLAALLALGSICGADRSEDNIILNERAEGCLKHLIYTTAANSFKLTPSGLLLSVLKQESEVRLAVRMDARHNCCVAINKALSASSLLHDATAAGFAGKLQEAVRRGPYLAKKHVEAQPVVGTMERF
ncbi:Proteasome non-ATPase 26S subunit [Carex littledalei]|uniref:Proteasome non-ATPase 26S subunit n=1 Tax=Carex littledalei TaxID=544730 RepID=A0A833RV88_9POAL|nr:Proteasome non-ATPase 26S subunit [Carex littledalei]